MRAGSAVRRGARSDAAAASDRGGGGLRVCCPLTLNPNDGEGRSNQKALAK